jgi:hypothetical protein
MQEHLKILGLAARDVVTGFAGIVVSVSFDLAGCVQALIVPGIDKDGKIRDACWYDSKRLFFLSKEPVMNVPTFEAIPGGEKLPLYKSQP